MAKINLTDITNGANATAAINANSAIIETTSDTFLSRTGEAPNYMEADLNMNSNRILNLLPGVGPTEPVTMAQLEEWTGGDGGGAVTISDGNKGDVTVSNGGNTWLLNTRNIAASNVTTGTLAPARLGSGTADSTTYLRGDNTWAAVAGPGGALPPDGAYGDIAVTGTGTTWTIPPQTITHSKYQNLSADRLLGTDTSSGPPTEIPCTATGRGILAASSTSNARSTLGLGALSVLNTVGTAELANSSVTHAKYQTIAADSLLGTLGSAGVPQAVPCTANGRVILASVNEAATRAWLGVPTVAHSHGEGEVTSVSATAINSGGGGTIAMTKLAPTPGADRFLRGDGTWMAAIGGNALLTSASNLNADRLNSGHVVPAVLGTGTPDGTKFLRDDGQWAAAPGASSTGFAECGGQFTIPSVTASGAGYQPMVNDTTGVGVFTFGNATIASNGITVTPGVTCTYEITVNLLCFRTSGTSAGYFSFQAGSDAYYNYFSTPVTTADPNVGTSYTFTYMARIASGTRVTPLFAKSTSGFEYSGWMSIKRVSST